MLLKSSGTNHITKQGGVSQLDDWLFEGRGSYCSSFNLSLFLSNLSVSTYNLHFLFPIPWSCFIKYCLPLMCLQFLAFFFNGHIWEFPGWGSNPRCHRDKTGSLMCSAIVGTPNFLFLIACKHSQISVNFKNWPWLSYVCHLSYLQLNFSKIKSNY